LKYFIISENEKEITLDHLKHRFCHFSLLQNRETFQMIQNFVIWYAFRLRIGNHSPIQTGP
jgi:hypothetical protein